MCIADQPPAHGDHDLFALIVSLTTRNHQDDGYHSAQKSAQHSAMNLFNSRGGCAAGVVFFLSIDRLLLVLTIYSGFQGHLRRTLADHHKWRKFLITADRRQPLFAPCVYRILCLCCGILLCVHRISISNLKFILEVFFKIS